MNKVKIHIDNEVPEKRSIKIESRVVYEEDFGESINADTRTLC